MNSLIVNVARLFIVYITVVSTVYCVDLHGVDVPSSQIASLTRDHFGRRDPDTLFNGFFPVWAVIQLILAGIFLVVGFLGLACYALGYRTPEEHTKRVK